MYTRNAHPREEREYQERETMVYSNMGPVRRSGATIGRWCTPCVNVGVHSVVLGRCRCARISVNGVHA